MRYLVTGGAGFIGSHLVEKLVDTNNQVTIIDNFSTGNAKNIANIEKKITIVQSDISSQSTIDKLVSECDYVVHLAAALGVFNIVNKPLESLKTNLQGSEIVLEACDKYRKPVLIASTSEIYGKNDKVPLNEEDDRIIGHPLKSRWSYSEAKAIDESLAYAYFIEKKLETRIVRFFNTVGPRQLGAYGMVIPRFVKSALNNEPITIYGNGNQTRCFAHVYDVIDAVIAIAFADNTIGKVINVGNNFEISINALAQKIIAETDSNSEIVYVPYAEAYGDGFEDMERRVPNIDLIKRLVGWIPQRDLSTIISDISAQIK